MAYTLPWFPSLIRELTGVSKYAGHPLREKTGMRLYGLKLIEVMQSFIRDRVIILTGFKTKF